MTPLEGLAVTGALAAAVTGFVNAFGLLQGVTLQEIVSPRVTEARRVSRRPRWMVAFFPGENGHSFPSRVSG